MSNDRLPRLLIVEDDTINQFVFRKMVHALGAECTMASSGEEALELLVMAYEALGRHAHAETAKVHHAHRDLASVGVFLRADEAEG